MQHQNSSDCGAASLAMISQYWDIHLNLYTLCKLVRVDRRGVSVQGLAEAAQTSRYEALSVRASLTKLDSYYNPWIADWQVIHYVVVWRVKGDRLLICDPAISKMWLSHPKFESSCLFCLNVFAISFLIWGIWRISLTAQCLESC
ncbi:cysteine peptidase family C39 domain-containing protein [Nostoc sp.]|uniref:cysteine peptidase family C39 domain-containing protein n=1 Tax=Nostoc sp. TaxID=1180 RepID=UPI002FF7AE7C